MSVQMKEHPSVFKSKLFLLITTIQKQINNSLQTFDVTVYQRAHGSNMGQPFSMLSPIFVIRT